MIFHVWEGRTEEHDSTSDRLGSYTYLTYHDKTEIDKINGNLFCFKKISYKELLYNGQIIKNWEDCPGNYQKNCGIIDTLEQKLCIKEDEKCPIYDLGIGEPKDVINYHYDDKANIYYNNDNYNGDKKIIGTLILNDGQPCYDVKEKLWRKFHPREATNTHLNCKYKVLGKLNDDRYENKGSISYKKLYEDNLSQNNQNMLFDKIKDETVSLYKRIFLGIDKKCDEYSKISKDKYDKAKRSQISEKKSLLAEAIFIIPFLIGFPISYNQEFRYFKNFFWVLSFVLFVFAICHSVFLGTMIHCKIFYNCSDFITNEMIKEGNKRIKNGIIFSAINLGFDIFFYFVNILFIIYNKISKCKCECDCLKKILQRNNNSYKNENVAKHQNNNVSSGKKPNKRIQEKPVSEVKINNDMNTQENQLNQTMNNDELNYPNTNLEVFPNNIQAATSKEKI